MATALNNEEEDNYVKMNYLLTEISQKAVRVFFDKEFPPNRLTSTLERNKAILKKNTAIDEDQWNLLYPQKGAADSNTFDISLMVCLISNLSTVVIPLEYGSHRLLNAMKTTTSEATAIAIIMHYKHKLSILSEKKIKTDDFNRDYSEISEAVFRLFDINMCDECLKFKDRERSRTMLYQRDGDKMKVPFRLVCPPCQESMISRREDLKFSDKHLEKYPNLKNECVETQGLKRRLFSFFRDTRPHESDKDSDNMKGRAKTLLREIIRPILANWKIIKQNIDPIPLLDELSNCNILDKEQFGPLGDKRRSHQSTLVLLAACKTIKTKEDFQKFTKVISKLSTTSAVKLNEILQQPRSITVARSEVDNQIKLLEQHRSDLEDGIYPDDLLKMVDDFIEAFIFDLDSIEQIISCFPSKAANVRFVNMIMSHVEADSYSCLIKSLQEVRNVRKFQHLFNFPSTSKASRDNISSEGQLSVRTSQVDLSIPPAEQFPSVQKDCNDMLRLTLTDMTQSSIVFHLKSEAGSIIDTMKSNIGCGQLEKFLEKQLNRIKLRHPRGFHPHYVLVNWAFKPKYTALQTDRVNIIDANRSFLIREMNVDALTTAFIQKGIGICAAIFTCGDLENKAKQLLHIIQSNNLTDMFMQILEEQHMSYVLRRLQNSSKAYKSNNKTRLEDKIRSNIRELSTSLDMFMIKETFVERNVFPESIFDDIEENLHKADHTQFILTTILNSGHFAMMTLVDVLFINDLASLASMLLNEHPSDDITEINAEDSRYIQKFGNILEGTLVIPINDKDFSDKCTIAVTANPNTTLKFEEDVRQPPIKRPPSPVDQSFRDDVSAWKKIRNETIPRLEHLERELRLANGKIKNARTIRNVTSGLSFGLGFLFAPFTGGASLAVAAGVSVGTTGAVYLIEMHIEKDVIKATQEGINKDKAETIRLRTRITSYQGGHKTTEEFVHDLGNIPLEAIISLAQQSLTTLLSRFFDTNSMSLLIAIEEVISYRKRLEGELRQVEEVEGRFY